MKKIIGLATTLMTIILACASNQETAEPKTKDACIEDCWYAWYGVDVRGIPFEDSSVPLHPDMSDEEKKEAIDRAFSKVVSPRYCVRACQIECTYGEGSPEHGEACNVMWLYAAERYPASACLCCEKYYPDETTTTEP